VDLNFCVHYLVSGQANMYIRHEGQASRGSQEVDVQELPQSVKHIEAFSDSAGGQNKNKQILKLWSCIVDQYSNKNGGP
jgi:hypothetical protein